VPKLRSMHGHPVKRGLAEKPEDWAWSTFRHHATGVEGAVQIELQGEAVRRCGQWPEHLHYREECGGRFEVSRQIEI